MKHKIYVTPIESVKLRRAHTPEELEWADEMAAIYCCRPLKKDGDKFSIFVADVFAAGRISGVREERMKRAARHPEPSRSKV